jgi:hypothetical protein
MSTEGKASWRTRIIVYAVLAGLAFVVLAMMFPVFSRSRESARKTAFLPGVSAIDPDTGAPRLAARGGGGRGGMGSATEAAAEMALGDEQTGFELHTASNIPPASRPMLIRTGSLRLRVEDVSSAHEEVGRIARAAGGYVASTRLSSEQGPTYAETTLRVPSEGLDSVVARIAGLGKLLSKELGTQEVTEEYVDLSSRKRNLEREEERLLELLQRAAKMEDLLKVEQYLARVRGQIETIAGRLRYLENRVSLSTLTIRLEGPQPKPDVGGPVWTATDVYRQAMRSLKDTGQGLATIGIWLGVYAPVWIPMLLVVVWLTRRAVRPSVEPSASGK